MIALGRHGAWWKRFVALGRRPEGSGRWGERVAARFLRRRGLRVVARNYRTHGGELDLVAWEGDTLVFVEVKTCRQGSRMHGAERVGAAKRRRVRRAAHLYLKRCRRAVDSWRIDVVAIEYTETRLRRRVARIDWYPAFFALD